MSRIKKKDSDGGGGGPAWLTTLSDLMQLLLTFFILLYSMSNLDEEKFATATSSIQDAFIGSSVGTTLIDIYEGNQVIPGQENTIVSEGRIGIEISPEIVEMYEKIGTFIHENELHENVDVRLDSDGVFVDIRDAILFESGKAD